MPQNIVDADTWTLTVEVAADGDPVDGASQLLIGQDLADRTRYLRNRTLGPVGDGLWWLTPLADYGAAQINDWITDTAINAYQQNGTGGLVDVYAAPLRPPASGRIEKVEVLLVGNGAGGGPHTGWPLGQLPTLSLYRNNYAGTGNNFQLVAQTTDPSTGAAAYDAAHWVTLSGLAEIIDDKTNWWVVVTGEGGANAIALALQLNTIRAFVVPS